MSSSGPVVSGVGQWPAPPTDAAGLLAWAIGFDKATRQRSIDLARRLNEEILQGTAAQRPPANGSMRFYWATDTQALSFDDSVWRSVGGGIASVLVDPMFWMLRGSR